MPAGAGGADGAWDDAGARKRRLARRSWRLLALNAKRTLARKGLATRTVPVAGAGDAAEAAGAPAGGRNPETLPPRRGLESGEMDSGKTKTVALRRTGCGIRVFPYRTTSRNPTSMIHTRALPRSRQGSGAVLWRRALPTC